MCLIIIIRWFLYLIHIPVADPGFVKRGGRESKFPARPEKVAQWGGGGGGTPTHFFPPEFFCRHLHYWVGMVGVPSAYQTDLRGGKQKKKDSAPLDPPLHPYPYPGNSPGGQFPHRAAFGSDEWFFRGSGPSGELSWWGILPYFGKRKQVTYHPNLLLMFS